MKAFKIPLLHHYYLSGPLLEALTTLTRFTQDILHPCTFCPLAQEQLRPRCKHPCLIYVAGVPVYSPDLLIGFSRLIVDLACLAFLWWSLDSQWDLSSPYPCSAYLIRILWACALLVRTVLCLCYDYAQLPACLPSQSSSILIALWYTDILYEKKLA